MEQPKNGISILGTPKSLITHFASPMEQGQNLSNRINGLMLLELGKWLMNHTNSI